MTGEHEEELFRQGFAIYNKRWEDLVKWWNDRVETLRLTAPDVHVTPKATKHLKAYYDKVQKSKRAAEGKPILPPTSVDEGEAMEEAKVQQQHEYKRLRQSLASSTQVPLPTSPPPIAQPHPTASDLQESIMQLLRTTVPPPAIVPLIHPTRRATPTCLSCGGHKVKRLGHGRGSYCPWPEDYFRGSGRNSEDYYDKCPSEYSRQPYR